MSADNLQEITVKPGDTLWSVSNYYLKDPQLWPEILKYNKLPSSDLNIILPGMKLNVPIVLIKEHLRSALLMSIINDVRFRRKAEPEWKNASMGMQLYNEDGVRTLENSNAKVKFASGEFIYLDQNSLIILKPENKREEANLLSGGVRASRTKILTSGSLVDPKISPRGPKPDFKTKIKADKTTLVEVYEGIVDVTAQGKTVTLTKGFGTEVKFSQPPSAPKILPPQPNMNTKTSSNMPGAELQAKSLLSANSLTLSVQSDSSSKNKDDKSSQTQMIGQIINKYHIQISTSYSFSNIEVDEIKPIKDKTDIDFKKNKLPDSVYYYRIAYMDDMGFEGQFSTPVKFIIDTTPPLIEIFSPKDGDEFDSKFLHIEGMSEPGSTLNINTKPVELEDTGKFFTALTPKKGVNTILITAKDVSGNISEKEINVTKIIKTVDGEPISKGGFFKRKSLSFASISLGTLTAAVIIGVLVFITN